MSPRPQIDHVRRPQILAAAAEVIAERGLAKTRIADVAARRDELPAVLYWFGTKNKLLTAALHEDERLFDELVAERLDSLDSPSAKLRAVFEICAEDANWTSGSSSGPDRSTTSRCAMPSVRSRAAGGLC